MTAFKAYDIRGRIPDELNPAVAWAIGYAFAEILQPGHTVIGYDIRESSPALSRALARGLNEGGSAVHDIGLCGTEEIYHATDYFGMGGGIMVTASHNPIDFNGMKLVREGARPVSGDSGLRAIEARVGELLATRAHPEVMTEADDQTPASPLDARSAYIDRLLGTIDTSSLKPLNIVSNAGNGGAGPVIDALEARLPFNFIKVHHEPDGTFPHGIPNPLLPENRAATAEAVIAHGADMGLAWDGDFDRCFFFDEQGRFIEGYYLVGLLAEQALAHHPGERIIHDPRLTWNTIKQVQQAGGTPVQSKTGHAFIKERMRAENAVYGGEMSAHHYFRDFAYCDSGMIPWLLIAEKLSVTGQALSTLVDERIAAYPCSGEINFTVDDVSDTITRIEAALATERPLLDRTDGVSLEFADWRLNLRGSNTEPVLRLNIETRGDPLLLETMTERLTRLINEPNA